MEPAKKGQARISGCLGSEVAVLYLDVLTEYAKTVPSSGFRVGKTVADLLKFDCWTEDWMSGYSRWKDTVWPVCQAKSSLKTALDKMGWGYISS